MNKHKLPQENKFGIIAIIATILMLVGGAYFFTKPEKPVVIPEKEAGSYEYFWGNGCPHCAAVQEFYDKWEKKDMVKIKKFEVWYDKANAKIMEERFNKCNPVPPKSEMAVPFLVTPDGKCLIGDTPIIEHYKSL